MDAVPVAWLAGTNTEYGLPVPVGQIYLARFGKSFFTKQIQRNENDKSPMCNEKTMKMQARYFIKYVYC